MRHRAQNQRGFTVVEVLISSALGTMLILAMLNVYVFLGKSMIRAANIQEMEYRSRIALGLLNRDIETASAVTSPTDASVVITVPAGTVTYTYSSVNKTLTRVATAGAFTNREFFQGTCTAFSFNYYTTTGTSGLTGTNLVPLSVKRISATFTLQRGSANLGTFTELTTVSARVLMRNKALPTGT